MPPNPRSPDRATSLGWIALVYAIACALAWIVMSLFKGRPVLGMGAGMAASVAVTFAASVRLRNGSVFDAWWSVLPPVVALHLASAWTPLSVACVLVVFVWAVRLTLNWAVGWPGLHHEDWRYVQLYERSPLPRLLTLLLAVQVVPAIFVFLGCLPLVPALEGGGALGFVGVLAIIVGVGAAGLELAADEQRRAFAAANPGALMNVGLWALVSPPELSGRDPVLGFALAFRSRSRPGHRLVDRARARLGARPVPRGQHSPDRGTQRRTPPRLGCLRGLDAAAPAARSQPGRWRRRVESPPGRRVDSLHALRASPHTRRRRPCDGNRPHGPRARRAGRALQAAGAFRRRPVSG